MNHFATSRLLKEIERLSTAESDMGGGGLDHDPIICAQDFDKEWAQNITVRDVQTVKEKTTATVEFRGTSFAPHQLKVALVKRTRFGKSIESIPRIDEQIQPIFFRNRSEQKQKSAIDMPNRIARFGQYSRKCAPRRMIARIKEIK